MKPKELDQQQLELLGRYLDALTDNVRTAPPPELDMHIVVLVDLLRPPAPDHSFVTTLRQRLEHISAEASPARGHNAQRAYRPRPDLVPAPIRRHMLLVASSVAAVALVLIACAGYFAFRQPGTVNAAEILRRAAQELEADASAPTAPFTMTARYTISFPDQPDQGRLVLETRRWVAPPDRWRTETDEIFYSADGLERRRTTMWILVSDGQTQWTYDGQTRRLTSGPYAGGASANTSLSLGNFDVAVGGRSLAEMLSNASRCFTPQYLGIDVVAHRQAYMIALGSDRCSSRSDAPAGTDSRIAVRPNQIWVDAVTFAVLKWTAAPDTTTNPRLQAINEVTDLAMDVDIPPETFAYITPAR